MTASYDYHIGVDYHKSYSHLVVQDSAGKTLRSGRVKNDRQSLGGFLERYRENSHAVVEATRNWMVIYDWLDDICDDVVLAHPLKVKAIADAKIKTDKIDATVLAHLLRADLVPEEAGPDHQTTGNCAIVLSVRCRRNCGVARSCISIGTKTPTSRTIESAASKKRASPLQTRLAGRLHSDEPP